MSGNPDAPRGRFSRNGIILIGHDHEGYYVYHHFPEADDKSNEARIWKAKRWDASIGRVLRSYKTVLGIREITLQSTMGEFRGSAALLSAKFDYDTGEWMTEASSCVLGKRHIWWVVHLLDIITLGSVLTVGLLLIWGQRDAATRKSGQKPTSTGTKEIRRSNKDRSARVADVFGRTTHLGDALTRATSRRARSRRNCISFCSFLSTLRVGAGSMG